MANADDLAACLARQKTTLATGDVLLVRTGWVGRFLGAASDDERDRLFRSRDYSGLSSNEYMSRFTWNHYVAAVASDSVTVEVWPLEENALSLHLAIARLGLVLGEMFDLDAFAEACAETSEYAAMFVFSPHNVRGGTGAPPNAMAIR